MRTTIQYVRRTENILMTRLYHAIASSDELRMALLRINQAESTLVELVNERRTPR
jgi:hypothetical protein